MAHTLGSNASPSPLRQVYMQPDSLTVDVRDSIIIKIEEVPNMFESTLNCPWPSTHNDAVNGHN